MMKGDLNGNFDEIECVLVLREEVDWFLLRSRGVFVAHERGSNPLQPGSGIDLDSTQTVIFE